MSDEVLVERRDGVLINTINRPSDRNAIGASRAAEVGLVNRVVPEGDALEAALELAAKIAANGPLAVTAVKAIARASQDWTLEESWEAQLALLNPVFTSADAREGAVAFAEKRPPVWAGR